MNKDKNYNMTVTDNVTHLDQQPEPIQPRPWYIQAGRRLIALVFVLATVFLLGGMYQFGLLRQTPQSAEPGTYATLVDQSEIHIPTTVFILSETDGRTYTNTDSLIDKTNAILTQAAVRLSVEDEQVVTVADIPESDRQISGSANELREQLPALDPGRLHIAITSGLTGINGVAFIGRQTVAVAEYNSTFDFRVLAHEVGHILSLQHTQSRGNLMRSGGSGTRLSQTQARQAYESAKRFLAES